MPRVSQKQINIAIENARRHIVSLKNSNKIHKKTATTNLDKLISASTMRDVNTIIRNVDKKVIVSVPVVSEARKAEIRNKKIATRQSNKQAKLAEANRKIAEKFYEAEQRTVRRKQTEKLITDENLITGLNIMEWSNDNTKERLTMEPYDLESALAFPSITDIFRYLNKHIAGPYSILLKYSKYVEETSEGPRYLSNPNPEDIESGDVDFRIMEDGPYEYNFNNLKTKELEKYKQDRYDDWVISGESGSSNNKIGRDDQIMLIQGYEIEASQHFQYFLDDKDGKHCFLDPIVDWANNLVENAKASYTKARYQTIINKINGYGKDGMFGKVQGWRLRFRDGFDEKFLSEFCNDININISIELPLGPVNKRMLRCVSNRSSIKEFKFLNTRFNHVDCIGSSDIDLNEMVLKSSSITSGCEFDISSSEIMEEIKTQLDCSGIYHQYSTNALTQINRINTASAIYKLKDDAFETISNFDLSFNMSAYTYDFVKDASLCKFIYDGVHYNNAVQMIHQKKTNFLDYGLDCYEEHTIDYHNVRHIDMPKAYTQFHQCPEFSGFLSKISDFRDCSSVEHSLNVVGMYEIYDIVFSDVILNINNKMPIYFDNNIYCTPELKFLVNNGCTFKVRRGCWGSTIDLSFGSVEQMENKEGMFKKASGIPLYSKWTGMCDMNGEYASFVMKGDDKFFQNMKFYNPELIIHKFRDGATIRYKKDSIKYRGHFSAFITTYQRLNLLHQVMDMDLNKIIRIATDGIYYYDHKYNLGNCFIHKQYDIKNVFINDGGAEFVSRINFEPIEYDSGEYLQHYNKNLYLGAGGSGKTHINLVDKGFTRILYVCPPWKLASAKKLEYNVDTSVLARCIIDSEESRMLRKKFDVIVFDECSQYTNEDKEKVFRIWNEHKVIFCGDIGFQLPPIEGKVMNSDGFDFIKDFKIVYRFECSKLASVCSELRNKIDAINNSKYEITHKQLSAISNYVIKECSDRIVSMEQCREMYCIEDYILVSKNKCNATGKDCVVPKVKGKKACGSMFCNCDGKNFAFEYTSMFSGKFDKEKYIVKKNTKTHNNGEIVFEKVDSSMITHAFSIHSIQGETCKNKIFIDMRQMFEPQMLYTAISRARRMEQIYFIV